MSLNEKVEPKLYLVEADRHANETALRDLLEKAEIVLEKARAKKRKKAL